MSLSLPQQFTPYEVNGGTIVAIAGEDFALIGADTRLSTGVAISTRHQKKLFQMSDHTVLGIAGCWADGLALTRLLSGRAMMYKHENGKSISSPAFAQMMSTVLYYKRFFPYDVYAVLAGLDTDGKGCVYNFDCLGHHTRSSFYAAGSAGTQIQPLLDNQIELKNMQNVTKSPLLNKKALALLKDVFTSAAERNIYTGDCVYIQTITANGIKEEKFELRKD